MNNRYSVMSYFQPETYTYVDYKIEIIIGDNTYI